MSVKAAHRTLMKLTPGLNFINILRKAFMRGSPKAYKKASNRTLMRLTPGVNFTNALHTAFMGADPKSGKRY